ncbi:hypothetical protein [Actinomadura terrae]|uniref:hypothetical protein n=1 Tax=Actinomadura terrae TaxID=604353 RepID=UPI001FA7BF8C|nr:hypothetical protein [Actinomadura terrae]
MLVPPSALARLRRVRRRPGRPARVARRFVARPAGGSPARKAVPRKDAPQPRHPPDEPDPGRDARPESSWAWTLYSRWEWITATARAERVLRRSRPPWH